MEGVIGGGGDNGDNSDCGGFCGDNACGGGGW